MEPDESSRVSNSASASFTPFTVSCFLRMSAIIRSAAGEAVPRLHVPRHQGGGVEGGEQVPDHSKSRGKRPPHLLVEPGEIGQVLLPPVRKGRFPKRLDPQAGEAVSPASRNTASRPPVARVDLDRMSGYRAGATVAVAGAKKNRGGRVSGGSFGATDGDSPSVAEKYPLNPSNYP